MRIVLYPYRDRTSAAHATPQNDNNYNNNTLIMPFGRRHCRYNAGTRATLQHSLIVVVVITCITVKWIRYPPLTVLLCDNTTATWTFVLYVHVRTHISIGFQALKHRDGGRTRRNVNWVLKCYNYIRTTNTQCVLRIHKDRGLQPVPRLVIICGWRSHFKYSMKYYPD